ncbi:hypothetical protein, partial [Salmonella enterica]
MPAFFKPPCIVLAPFMRGFFFASFYELTSLSFIQRHKKLFRVTEPIRLLSDVAILVKVFSKGPVKCHLLILKLNPIMQVTGFAPIFPDICYHLTHYKPAAADIPVASDNPAHYADAIRYNAR